MQDVDEYQEKTALTDSSNTCTNPAYLYYVLGMCGEAGEAAEKVKKLVRNKKGVVDEEFIKDFASELGDQMWYISRIAALFGIKMSTILDMNLEKLFSRLERGTIKSEGDYR